MTTPAEMGDAVHDPAHYRGDGKIHCKDALRSMLAGYGDEVSDVEAYWAGCALKYLWRWPGKNGLQDIDKGIQCLETLKKEHEWVEHGGP